ncbi:MAG: acetylxylan esterase [Verrucomicrobiota bacterium]
MRIQPASFFAFTFVILMAPDFSRAQQTTVPFTETNLPAPMNWSAEQDHQNMMEQLGIKTLRPGANGLNRQAPNYQNTDESKANPFPNLPDPLTLKNGERVTTPKMWWNQRRSEIVEDFDREVYGRVPANVPKVNWEVTSVTKTNNGTVPVITKQLVGHVDNTSYPLIKVDIQLTLTTPANATGPVPVMMDFSFGNFPGFGGRGRFSGTNGIGGFDGTNRFARGSFGGGLGGGTNWRQLVLARGWGYAVIVPTSYQADNGAGLTRGIIGLCNKGQPRKPDDWGALRAWAWGASRALDYFETDPAVDAKQVGIEGLSRYGKATLVTMAYDQRFAIALVGSSGEGGAKLSRRNWGEVVENLTGSGEYHWMAGNFLKYGGPLTPGDLPVDAHELIALCAPRPTFISYGASSGTPGAEGTWVDQHGSFMAAVAAGAVFKLLGKKDLGTAGNYLTDPMPPLNTALIDGDLAWRQHDGGHTDGPNWPTFLKWADRYIHSPPVTTQATKTQ